MAFSIPTILLTLYTWQRLAIALGLLAVYGLVVTGKDKWVEHRSRNWPSVEVPITDIEVKLVDGGINGVDYWKLTFHYKYTVTAEHEGKYSINLVTEKLRDQAEAGLAGKNVKVRYNPKNEAKSVVWYDEVWDLW